MKLNPISGERQPEETLLRELTEQQTEYVTGGYITPDLRPKAPDDIIIRHLVKKNVETFHGTSLQGF